MRDLYLEFLGAGQLIAKITSNGSTTNACTPALDRRIDEEEEGDEDSEDDEEEEE